MKSTVFQLATWLICLTTISAQTLISSLEARPELVLFNGYIQSFPTLLDTLTNITNYTLLAPSDIAMTRWLNGSSPSPTQDEIETTLNYHILHGSYSLASFSATPLFASSYLSNTSLVNQTGGAVVELLEAGASSVALSGDKTMSTITTGNLIASGGLFHIVDTVLQIPQSESATATEAGMEYYIDIITKGGYLTGKANEINNALEEEPNMTFFIPNTAAASDNFTSITAGWTTDQLNALLTYHAVPGIVAYSSTMSNRTVLPTVQGGQITIYVGEDGTMYANNVRIVVTDYLISNGVMHTIDGVLNPYNITQPVFPSVPPTTKKHALSTGAVAGISILGALVLLSILAGAFWYRRRSKQLAAAKATDHIIPIQPKSSKRKSAVQVSDKQHRSHGSRKSKEANSNHRNHSNRSTATKTSQRSSQSSYDKAKESKAREKARAEVEVRRVVGEQLDAFRRSGYYDIPSSPRTNIVLPVIPAVEMDAGPALVRRHSTAETELDAGSQLVGRHELFGGEIAMPVIEEAQEEAPASKEISRTSSRAMILDRR